ncbi:MFS transporter, DHA2 family, methylenomycin A resistance protein [Actinacidiphila yanglinensis]|uniref:MFS transporter, DHA2 family, methylenomycin A resistance protein n=1 Tax=Actinacidiphila yanglinensis TaxID=310779 RepID=A0A1H6ADP0_9ACTN|nr:MFS transporter [Actinacidiphila yanglinensis]SEG46838.1 MFS transporter, DHA2 family, methylenomycin A resistance protein [Actinacidiphila yanglinensis]
MSHTLPPTLPPQAAPPAPRTGPALLGIALGYFMVLLDTTVLSVAEPDLARSLGSSTVGLQWVVTGYTVAFGALLLSAGAVGDRYGAHRVFRAGVAAFGAGSLLSVCAPGLWTLVGLRAVLGVAAAACVPSSMAMITRLYPEPARRARAVAVWAAVSGAALAAGPIAGGLLVALAGWRAVFVVNVPLAVVVLALVAGPSVRCPRGERRIDWGGQLAACAALALTTDALIAFGAHAAVHGAWSAAGAVAAGALFARRERRSASPVLVPAVLRAPGMAPMLAAGAAVGFALTAVLFVLPLFLQATRGYGTVAAGAAFLPLTLPTAVNPLLVTGRLVARLGPDRPVRAGLALLVAAGGVMAGAAGAGAPYPVLAVGLCAAGCGVSLALPALTTAVITLAPPGSAGAAGGLLNAVRQLGATLGVAVLGAFVAVHPSARGAACGLLLPAPACALAVVLSLVLRAARSRRAGA